MRERDVHNEMEAALQRLMPVGLSQAVQEQLEANIDDLADEARGDVFNFRTAAKWSGGLTAAAVVAFGLFVGFTKYNAKGDEQSVASAAESKVIFLEEADRVEEVSDDGLFVDAGGSAVRKVRVRVVEESRMRDEGTGIEVSLSAPREETYLLPISTF